MTTTRTERLSIFLEHFTGRLSSATVIGNILAITDDRTLMLTQDFARRIRRHPNTLIGWARRGQHEVPEPAGRFGPEHDGAPYWDIETVDAWAVAHPNLVGAEKGDPFAKPPKCRLCGNGTPHEQADCTGPFGGKRAN